MISNKLNLKNMVINMTKIDEAKKIKAEIEELKKKTKILEAKPAKKVAKKAKQNQLKK